jgi:hypothetical protein
MSQPTTTEYLRQATHFINYAAFLHFKRFHSVLMAPPQSSKECVHWTEDEIYALVEYLYDHRSEGEGGTFKKQTYQGASSHLQPLRKQGGPKDATNVKEKFSKVSALQNWI